MTAPAWGSAERSVRLGKVIEENVLSSALPLNSSARASTPPQASASQRQSGETRIGGRFIKGTFRKIGKEYLGLFKITDTACRVPANNQMLRRGDPPGRP